MKPPSEAQPGHSMPRAPRPGGSSALRAVVLLAGVVRPSDLTRGIARSLLDLPVDDRQTVMDLWRAQIDRLAETGGLASLPVRLILDQRSPAPAAIGPGGRVSVEVEREAAELRGTAGILRDVSREYRPDDLILVGNGAQLLLEDLSALTETLLDLRADIALVGHDDGTPAGLFLLKCGVLADVRDIGFQDLKEQVLPRLAAAGADIRVLRRPEATGTPVRTLDGYIAGLQRLHRGRHGVGHGASFEDWSPSFAITEPGATVHPSATIHDSVILRGAVVERGAVVVRSVVCPGARVGAGDEAADQIVTPGFFSRASRPARSGAAK